MEKLFYGNHMRIGVLGGGQLGRMLIQSAISYDARIEVMENNLDVPSSAIAHKFVKGDITDYDDVLQFGADKDVITVEIENVNIEALEVLERKGVKVFPQPRVLKIIKDKGLQKQFYKENNIPTADFKLVENANEATVHADFLPFFQKLRTGGYDGRGVRKISAVNELSTDFDEPTVLEKFVDFEKELSVIVARNERGEVVTYPLVECEFSPSLNLVEFLFSPANVSAELENVAAELGKTIIEKLDMVGLLAVELFLTKSGELLVNEIAPRPHNSGHHTIECNFTSQFEQHLRSITNQSLGSTDIVIPGVMVNLLGAEGYEGNAIYSGMNEFMGSKGVYFHLYGKSTTKPYRKMGHVTIVNTSLEQAKLVARTIKDQVKVISGE
jgi:5-(carboxyamino)imidazole ribonucleotide synthase